MITIKTQEEAEALIKDGILKVKDDLRIECDICINAHIEARNIEAWNIDAHDIKAWNIDADDINARDIKAHEINYYAVCFAYENIKCNSIKGEHKNSKHFCLDGKITIVVQI